MPLIERTRRPWRFAAEDSEKRRRVVDDFIHSHGLKKELVEVLGCRILIIDGTNKPQLASGELIQLAQAFINIKDSDNNNECYRPASQAVYSGLATGRLAAPEKAYKLVPWDNHCINYLLSGDSSVLSFDLTTDRHIDAYQDNFQLLVLRFDSLPGLLTKLGELYGGTWSIIPTYIPPVV